MTTLREAAQAVLREWDAGMKGWPLDEAIAALRAALAQQAEPVVELTCVCGAVWQGEELVCTPTRPPTAQRKLLTDEEVDAVVGPLGFAQLSPREVARAIERAHGITEPDLDAPERRCGGPGCNGKCCVPACPRCSSPLFAGTQCSACGREFENPSF